MFMVGDVKQSIYRFRQARPELYLEKYNRFKLREELEKENSITEDLNQKIQLFNNFRSRELVLEFANLVFKNIMTPKVGNIDYTEEEYLNFTALFEEPQDNSIDFAGKMNFEIVDTKDFEFTDESEEGENSVSTGDFENLEEDSETKNRAIEDIQENLEKIEIEARYVAYRIKEIIDSKYNVWDKEQKAYRPATYKDFVILLRSTSNVAPIFEKEVFKLNMPVFSDGSQKYLESLEIETILNLLKIIDNPMQDIPLVSVLRSYIGGFNDNEMLEIRLDNIKSSFYESMISYINGENNSGDNDKLFNTNMKVAELQSSKAKNIELQNKVKNFISKLTEWQDIVKYMPLDEFIWKIYIDTGYYNYVSMMNDGNLKVANLKMLFERAKQYEMASFKGLYNFIKLMDKLKKNEGDLESAKLIGENDNVIRIMSIHKSKGLEFPIVFLSTTGKKFNLRDLNDNILLHQDLGIGPKYVNYERKIEYSTLAREALKIKLKNDSLSEEMRVLYVALTRPKEKLIITGTAKDARKKFEEKRVLLEASKRGNVNVSLLKKYTSYLDWLELAYLNDIDNMNKSVDFNILDLNDIVSKYESFNEELLTSNNDIRAFLKDYKFNKADYEEIEKILLFKYKKQELTTIQSKISVTALKEKLKNNSLENIESVENDVKNDLDSSVDKNKCKNSKFEENKLLLDMPKFMKSENVKFTKAEIGTVTHLIFQKIDFKREYTLEILQDELNKYVEKEIITKEQKDVIDLRKVYTFIKSDFATRIKNAKKIYTEAPFYMNIDVSEISKPAKKQGLKEKVLVQGIIDLYFEEEDGKLVLLDYKTDYINPGEEDILAEKHKEQLLVYKNALEEATRKEVKEVYIYSTCIDKVIRIDNFSKIH